MKRWIIGVGVLLLAGCTPHFDAVREGDSPQLLVYSQLDTTLSFYTEDFKEQGQWRFEEPYTGMALLKDDKILLYGYGLGQATVYDLTTGRPVGDLSVEEGVVSAYVDETGIYLANSVTNTVKRFTLDLEEAGSIQTGDYPMSMTSFDELLYVVNYQDSHVSVIDQSTFEEIEQFEVAKASQGIYATSDSLYIGGHGSGATVNSETQVLNRATGTAVTSIDMPMMPIAFTEQNELLYVLSHGSNQLYQLNEDAVTDVLTVASNPFTLGATDQALYVAGYDDDTLYKIVDMQVVDEAKTGDGPLQLLIREATK
ncbi:hypothetical protein CF394_01135 [Tetzosporium hominis]|uniref:YncE family protein n=1 Tax=Tetzosporium hominis TaxID=2020506 RepID=A0A264W668_9BACL|nr:hypothetical protein [Tetzosporium hominis]OZS79055.1 hypothetical protein CF394_01135 [Tetzosporium hominis]